MTTIHPSIDRALDALVEPAASDRPDWAQVTRRLEAPAAPARISLRRSHALRFAAALVIAAAVAAALLVGLPRGGHASVLDRALAAVGSGPVVHIVQPSRDGNHTLIEIATGAKRVPTSDVEIWIDEGRGVVHEIARQDGVVVADDLLTRDGTYSWESGRVLPPSPRKYLAVPEPLRGFATRYRDALASGAARIERKDRLNGRPVYWLGFEPRQEQDRYTNQITRYLDEVAIDRKSYRPLAIRTRIDGQPAPLTHISLIESVARDRANLAQPTLKPMPRGEDVIHSEQIAPAAAAAALGATPVWAGRRVAGLPFSGAYEQTLRTWYPKETKAPPLESHGVVFVYGATPGDLNHGSEFLPKGAVAVRESTKQESFYGWQQNPPLPDPPAGQMRMSGPYYVLKANGLYVSIQAPDEQTALAVARALRAYSG